jgi:biotin-(acetyl-CoA carboxylase) ligase
VCVTADDQTLIGIMTGVDEHGALLLETDTGRRVVSGGEVSLRATETRDVEPDSEP